jgi:serine O-acetyltransferase
MFEHLRRDAAKYPKPDGWYSHSGFWIVAVYRLGAWANSLPSALLRLPVWALYRLARFPLYHWYKVDIWAGKRGARIGAGLCLIHPSNISIGAGVEIGEDCLIFHEVTIGTGPAPGAPKIGNHVDIYVGARILGGVTIGDDCMIGANCVVLRNLPPRSVAVPPPIRVIPRSLSQVAYQADHRTRANAAGQSNSPPS